MTFDDAFELLIGHEGGYTNNPDDPGGETKYGISKRAYPNLAIESLTLYDAKVIYKRDYWDKLPAVPSVLSFQLFDVAVNSGVGTAVKLLQKAVGTDADGAWGPKSQAALNTFPSPAALVMHLTAERMAMQADLKTWPVFGRGWTHRNAINLRIAAEEV